MIEAIKSSLARMDTTDPEFREEVCRILEESSDASLRSIYTANIAAGAKIPGGEERTMTRVRLRPLILGSVMTDPARPGYVVARLDRPDGSTTSCEFSNRADAWAWVREGGACLDNYAPGMTVEELVRRVREAME